MLKSAGSSRICAFFLFTIQVTNFGSLNCSSEFYQMKKLVFLSFFLAQLGISNAQSFLERGVTAFHQENYKDAVTWFNWAIKADSLDANRYLNRGHAKRALNNYQGALKDFSKAVELDSANGDAHFLVGLCAFYLNDFNLSIEANSKAIEYGSAYGSQTFMNRSQAYVRAGKDKKALEDLASVIALNDQNLMNAHFERGQLYMRMNNKKSALADYKTVVELNPKNIQLTWDVGRVSYEIEEYADALAYYSRAMEQIDNPEAQLYMIRGETFEKLKHYEAAIEDYSRVIEMQPNFADAHYSRGQAKARAGKNEEACVDWIKASELGHQEAKGVIVYNCK